MMNIIRFFLIVITLSTMLTAQPGTLYFSDSERQILHSINNDRTNRTAIVSGEYATDLTYFPTGDVVFWTDQVKGTLECISTNGNGWQLVVPNLIKPTSSVAHTPNGHIYIMEAGKGRIIRTKLDGSDLQVIVSGIPIDEGSDLALDIAGGKIYWAIKYPGSIWRANLNGTAKQQWLTNLYFPDNLIIDSLSAKAYFTQNSGAVAEDGIFSCSLSGNLPIQVVPGNVSAFDLENNQLYFTSGLSSKLFRSATDGTGGYTYQQGEYQNVTGLEVRSSDSTIYWASELYGPYIFKSNLNGSQRQVLRNSEIYNIGQIAVNPATGAAVWVNRHSSNQSDTSSAIRRRPSANSTTQNLVKSSPDARYLGMTVDWINERVFYTRQGDPAINRVKLNGSGDSQIPSSPISYVQYMRYNPQNGRIYWSDFGLDKIMSILPNGADEQTIATGVINPKGLDFDTASQMIYFVDDGGIKRMKYDGSQMETLRSASTGHKAIAVNQQLDEVYFSDWAAIYKMKKNGILQGILVENTFSSNIQDIQFSSNLNTSSSEAMPLPAQFTFTQDEVQIRFEEPQNGNISIYNTTGQRMHSQELNSELQSHYNANPLPQGLYFVVITNTLRQKAIYTFVKQ